jgi:hypothetical protein
LGNTAMGFFSNAPYRLNTDSLGRIGVRGLRDSMLFLAVDGPGIGIRILIYGRSLLSVSGKMPRA